MGKLDLRQHPQLYSAVRAITTRLPKRWIYPAEYFEILALKQRRDSGKAIADALDRRLAHILRTALADVPYYRELRLGVDPRDITPGNARQALEQFPFLRKETIMANPARFLSARHDAAGCLVDTSGGSTGEGIKLYTTYRQKLVEPAFFDHGWGKCGYRRSATVIRMGSDGKKKETEDPFTRFPDKLLLSPYHFNEKWIHAIYLEIEKFRGEYIHAYPSCFEYLADHMSNQGLRLKHVRGIFLGSERITERQLDLAATAFPGVPVVFWYGLSERSNLAWGEYANGAIRYQFDPVYGYTEALRGEGGRSEVVGTSYWNDVMPLIRYRTQDYASIRDGAMDQLDGRDQEFLVTKTGARIPGFSISIDKFTWDHVSIFQIVQNEPGKVEFRVVTRPTFTQDVAERILRAQQEKWGAFFEMRLIPVPSVPRTRSGKTRLIVTDLDSSKGTPC